LNKQLGGSSCFGFVFKVPVIWLGALKSRDLTSRDLTTLHNVERDECVEPCYSNMEKDEEAVVLVCTSFIVCALCVHVNEKEKTTRSVPVWVIDYLLKKRDFWMF